MISLSARQAMASTELTISKGSDGQWNMSDVRMYMKDTGDSRSVYTSPWCFSAYGVGIIICTDESIQ